MRLVVTKAFAIAELGTVAFLDSAPDRPVGSSHRCRVTQPNGATVESIASIETVRRESSGEELPALLFASLTLADVAAGSTVIVLEGAGS